MSMHSHPLADFASSWRSLPRHSGGSGGGVKRRGSIISGSRSSRKIDGDGRRHRRPGGRGRAHLHTDRCVEWLCFRDHGCACSTGCPNVNVPFHCGTLRPSPLQPVCVLLRMPPPVLSESLLHRLILPAHPLPPVMT